MKSFKDYLKENYLKESDSLNDVNFLNKVIKGSIDIEDEYDEDYEVFHDDFIYSIFADDISDIDTWIHGGSPSREELDEFRNGAVKALKKLGMSDSGVKLVMEDGVVSFGTLARYLKLKLEIASFEK